MSPFRSDLQAAHDRIRALEMENARLRGESTEESPMPTSRKSFAASFVRLLAERVATAVGSVAAIVLFLGAFYFCVLCYLDLIAGPCSDTDTLCHIIRSLPSQARWTGVLLPIVLGIGFLLYSSWCDAKNRTRR